MQSIIGAVSRAVRTHFGLIMAVTDFKAILKEEEIKLRMLAKKKSLGALPRTPCLGGRPRSATLVMVVVLVKIDCLKLIKKQCQKKTSEESCI